MTIEEAIIHAREVADEKYKEAFCCCANSAECAKEHEQLAEWLEELQQYRKIGTVKECEKARERQVSKNPIMDRALKCLGCYQCPICGGLLMCTDKYCSECGQSILQEGDTY